MVFETHCEDETKQAAYEFAKMLKPSDVICMYGDLGVGKSVFVRGIAEFLDIKEPITSPTFTIINEYCGKMPLYHFDVYRISESDEMYEIGYDDYVNGNGVTVIEWAELIEDILPDSYYRVTITKDYDKGDDFRKIEIEKSDGDI